ncbi:MAG: Dolichyl-phosphate-mannose-protein mannosyltransferase [Actinomycetia bacterium]|nr:Dolichyl-phosphate-mannose-protein mannosyltransferase [Actinomycetes bacterium]
MSRSVTKVRFDRFWRVLLVIVFGALVVRVGYVSIAKRGPCAVRLNGAVVGQYHSECTGLNGQASDQVFYNAESNTLAQGHAFTAPFPHPGEPGVAHPPTAEHPPLTVMVLAPVSWLFERPVLRNVADKFEIAGQTHYTHVREQRYAMALLGTLLVLLIGLLGRAIGGERVGWVAAGIAALYPNLWVSDGLIMSETITGLAVVAAMLCALRMVRRPSVGAALATGVFAGLAALGRAELVLFIPLLVVPVAFFARAGRGRATTLALVGCIAAAAVIVPWVGYNLARFHERTFVSTNDGIALVGSNCDPVYKGSAIGLTVLRPPCLDSQGLKGDESVLAKVYRTRAIDYMKGHKRRVPVVVAARVGRTWGVFRPMDMLWFNQGEGRERWVIALGMWTYYPLLLLGVAGAIVWWRRSARQTWVLLVPAIASTIGVAATYGQTRFRAAAEPSIVVFAAVAIVVIVDQLRARTVDPAPEYRPVGPVLAPYTGGRASIGDK